MARSRPQVGGTSLSSPMFVGFWARVMAGKGNLGFPAPLLYPLSASDFHDITSGRQTAIRQVRATTSPAVVAA